MYFYIFLDCAINTCDSVAECEDGHLGFSCVCSNTFMALDYCAVGKLIILL